MECANLSPSPFKESECEKDEIVEKEQSSLSDTVLAVQVCFGVERSPTLLLFRNHVAKQELRAVTGYEPKRKDSSYVHDIIMSKAPLDEWVATVKHSSV